MQNNAHNEDTEWNDILRSKGIIPEKEKEFTEEEIVKIVEDTVNGRKTGDLDTLTLEELDEIEDEEEERILQAMRQQRIAELKEQSGKSRFGDVREISGQDYVDEVNKAGEGIWVVLHLYKQGRPFCSLINQFISALAEKFPHTKFLRSIASTCIPNFPEENLPSLFVYYEGKMQCQLYANRDLRGMNMTVDELEWILSKHGAVKSSLKSNPAPKVKDVLFSAIGQSNNQSDKDSD